jgi:FlaA1/EpsC-like NDP-sugar epimerase
MIIPLLADLEKLVTRRARSYFATDVERRHYDLEAAIGGRRILIIGGGGSIGGATTLALLAYQPAAVHIVDLSENYLAELIRDVRSGPTLVAGIDLQTHVFDYGSATMRRFLAASRGFDAVLNFAAVKHVRSEKDIYSLLHMLDVNVVGQWRLRQWLAEFGHKGRYFTVSTDKAANPSSLMGASKRIMEDVAFDSTTEPVPEITSARFANVAFSNGSLLQAFLSRLGKRQPIAVPRDTRRYFITHEEAGHICLLASFLSPAGYIAIPRFQAEEHLVLLEEVAARVLDACGLQPQFVDDEGAAKAAMAACEQEGRWPVLRTPLDTSGEKPFEEFVGNDERVEEIGFSALRGVQHHRGTGLDVLVQELQALTYRAERDCDKEKLVRVLAAAVPMMHHVETGRHLDERM